MKLKLILKDTGERLTKRLTLLNTSILTTYGTFSYESLTLAQAQALVRDFQTGGREVVSAIGHTATAELLSALLDYTVAVQRVEFRQTLADMALVFKLRGRVSEGQVLNREQLEAIGYEFGLLQRLA